MAVILQYPFGRSQFDTEQHNPIWTSIADVSDLELNDHPTLQVGVHSKHFALIPSDYFDAEAAMSYLTQLGMPPNTPFAINAIPEWKAHLVFSLERLPTVPPASVTWSVWRGLLYAGHAIAQQDANAGMLVHVTPGQIYLIGFEGETLQFFNTFPTRDIHDLLYFMLHGLDQWGKSPIHLPVHISGHFTIDSPLFKLLEGYFGNLHLVSTDLYSGLPNSFTGSGHQFFDLCSFAACVSSAEN